MSTDELHEKYAPVMHFSGGERFFPMSIEDFLTYAVLYQKEKDEPLVARGRCGPAISGDSPCTTRF